MLKMVFLHESKLGSIERWIDMNYLKLCDDSPLQLPGGVCYFCKTPQEHTEGKCKTLTRVQYFECMFAKTEEDYQWHFTEAQRFLSKAQCEMVSLRHRRYLHEYFAKLECEAQDTTYEVVFTEKNYPASVCKEIRSIEKRNLKKMTELKEDLVRKSKEHYDFQMEKRKNRQEEMMDFLIRRDRMHPEVQREFV